MQHRKFFFAFVVVVAAIAIVNAAPAAQLPDKYPSLSLAEVLEKKGLLNSIIFRLPGRVTRDRCYDF
jgi:hypothetical protein